jgi:L-asparaginase/Glu-tRNA(Gln) amidotransferase subunit D
MAHVVVLGTGGTIASTSDPSGTAAAERRVGEISGADGYGDVEVAGRDLINVGAYLLGQRELRIGQER